MYKVIFFIKKIKDVDEKQLADDLKSVLKNFKDVNLNSFNVESNLLTDSKYKYLLEISFENKDEWDKKMSSKEGKNLSEFLTDRAGFVDIINLQSF